MKQQRAPYAIVSDETWELVRAAYLSGLSASVVAARFGITVWGLRKRAGREGWTKRDYAAAKAVNGEPPGLAQAFEPPEALEAPDDPLPVEQVLKATMARVGRSLVKGEGVEAQALVRATEGYLRLDASVRESGWETGEFAMTPARRACLSILRDAYGLQDPPED